MYNYITYKGACIIMKNAQLNWVRLPLEGVMNCRELGGYGTKNGEQVKWRTFLRSSDMNELTESDISFLEDYGIKTVIDLRSAHELAESPNPLATIDSFDYYNIPFASQPITDISTMKDTATLKNMKMGGFYVNLLEESEQIKPMFDTIDQASEGGIVFHCAAGKDRTGVLAMLILGLAGVEKKDIIANYEVTYTNMEYFQSFKKNITLPYDIPKEFLYSSREYIIEAYDHIIDGYVTFENYLLSKGIEEEILHRLKERLGVKARENVTVD